MTASVHKTARLKVAVVATDPARRAALGEALGSAPDIEVLAWADSPEPLTVLGTRSDVCLCVSPPSAADSARLHALGCRVVVDDGDPVAAVRAAAAAGTGRPDLSARQREVLAAYVSSSDLLPTLARRLEMDPETMQTHLRRIRAKYIRAGRPAPTRRDLYIRAVEDGVLPPPSGWRPHG